jgi:ubiquinone/menaquinone biosynthesis C-methylase UbiE
LQGSHSPYHSAQEERALYSEAASQASEPYAFIWQATARSGLRLAEEYEASSWKLGTPRGQHVLRRRLRAVLPLVASVETVLDVGCGPATLSQYFPCRTVGCDLSLSMLSSAKKRLHAVVLCDALHLPFKDGAFDKAFESSCLYLLGDKVGGLEEMLRVSRGGIVAFESNIWSLRRLLLGSKERHPSPPELKRYYTLAGVKPKVTYVGFAPFSSWKLVFRLWSLLEQLIERVPVLNYLCGGIMAYADSHPPGSNVKKSAYSRLVLHPTAYVALKRNWLAFGLVLLPVSLLELLRYLIRILRRGK